MKKIAAVAIAGALTAGVTAISQPADAYGIKPTLCQILGAGENAPVFVRGRAHSYPAQYFVKAPGAIPTGSIHVYYSGAANTSFAKTLSGGTAFQRVHVNKGRLVIKIGYGGGNGFASCSAAFSTRIK